MNEKMSVDEFKQNALERNFSKLKAEGCPAVDLMRWAGVGESGYIFGSIWYHLDGNRLRVSSSNGDIYYTLS